MGQTYGYIPGYPTIKGNLAAIGIILALTFGFYVLKQLMYNACGYIFAASGLYKAWYSGYSASAGLFGAAMYIPVISAAYTSVDSRMTLYAAVALYAMWRMIIAYRTIIVFNIRGVGFLYIILYLCAQEILPLVLIYEGVIYLYNLY
jgi:hypothetical protein